jgi:thiamine-phosphate pyrophosphorylase
MKNALPRLMLVTQRERMQPDFLLALEAALRGGARLIQLREKELPDDELRALAQRAQNLCEKYGATLLINSAPNIAQKIGAGLHWPESELESGGWRLEANHGLLCGISTHSLQSARRAAEQGADYIVFGSVFETQSHPGAAPAGLERLREVCAAVPIPVFAIGGITAQSAKECFAAGAHGIAVIGAAWDAEDVESAVRALILATDEHR